MIKATKIKMHTGQEKSNSVTEIESIYLTGTTEDKLYKKEAIHDFLVENPGTPIYVDITPKNPKLIPVKNNTQKYVRSEQNDTPNDNLLKLPRV